MQENVVRVEISVNDWLGQGMKIVHAPGHIQGNVELEIVRCYTEMLMHFYLLSDVHVTPLLM